MSTATSPVRRRRPAPVIATPSPEAAPSAAAVAVVGVVAGVVATVAGDVSIVPDAAGVVPGAVIVDADLLVDEHAVMPPANRSVIVDAIAASTVQRCMSAFSLSLVGLGTEYGSVDVLASAIRVNLRPTFGGVASYLWGIPQSFCPT